MVSMVRANDVVSSGFSPSTRPSPSVIAIERGRVYLEYTCAESDDFVCRGAAHPARAGRVGAT
jgi:hypothetical protein